MVKRIGTGRVWMAGVLAVLSGLAGPPVRAQGLKTGAPAVGAAPAASTEQPDAQRIKQGLSRLQEGRPPSLRSALALDGSLLSNQPFWRRIRLW